MVDTVAAEAWLAERENETGAAFFCERKQGAEEWMNENERKCEKARGLKPEARAKGLTRNFLS